MTKMAEKVSSAMTEQIAATNKKVMESILETLSKMNLKGYGLLLTPDFFVISNVVFIKKTVFVKTFSKWLKVYIPDYLLCVTLLVFYPA